MAARKTQKLGMTVGIAAALVALRPIGPLERAADLALLPARLLAPLAVPSRWFAGEGGAAETLSEREQSRALEASLSSMLEGAVLRSAWPDNVPLGPNVVPVPGEVDTRIGSSRDRIRIRVSDPDRVTKGQPVVAGDVYVGSVERVPFREMRAERPGRFERVLRFLRLSSAPVPPPQDAVDVRLITDPTSRVGGLVLEDQDGRPCRLVAGGLAPQPDDVWLAVHNPESRATRSGIVVVHEPLGLESEFDSLAEGFLLGQVVEGSVRIDESFERDVLGIRPYVDFESGLNQVLVLTSADGRMLDGLVGDGDVVPVLEDGGWADAKLLAVGDTSPWRASARLDRGRDAGVRRGAAVVDGVRLLGRVSRSDHLGAAVSLIGDPGLLVNVIAQWEQEPESEPVVLGALESLGRSEAGVLRFVWRPESGGRQAEWIRARLPRGGRPQGGAAREEGEKPMEGGVKVRLWTGSGMARVPRGLLLGSTVLPAPGGSEAKGSESDAEGAGGTGAGDPLTGGAGGAEGSSRLESGDLDPRDLDPRDLDPGTPELRAGLPEEVTLELMGTASVRADLRVRIGGARLGRRVDAAAEDAR